MSLGFGFGSGTGPVFPPWIRRVPKKKSRDPEADAITGRAKVLVEELAAIADWYPPEAMIKGRLIVKELAEIAKSSSVNVSASYIEKNNERFVGLKSTVKSQSTMNVLLFGLFFTGLMGVQGQLQMVQVEGTESKAETKVIKKRMNILGSEQEKMKRRLHALEAKLAKDSQAPEEVEGEIEDSDVGTEEAEPKPLAEAEPVGAFSKVRKALASYLPF